MQIVRGSMNPLDKSVAVIKGSGVALPQNMGNRETQTPNKAFVIFDNETHELTTVGEQALLEAIEKANKMIEGANRVFEYSIHDKTNVIMVKVVNSETKEVIREIPPEKILNVIAQIWEMAGIIVDERI
ncbi:MAG: flagellar protein FlaG [Clostridia bacterium]|jgi:flagellar protein FlaG